jgi:hypothetical protein
MSSQGLYLCSLSRVILSALSVLESCSSSSVKLLLRVSGGGPRGEMLCLDVASAP